MVEWMEMVLQDHERLFLRTGTEPMQMIMKEPSSLGPRPDLTCLPEFWQKLILKKSKFATEEDYYAAIRLLFELQKIIGELISPFFKTSLVACKVPGAMCDLERDANLARPPTQPKATGPLNESTPGAVPPLDDTMDFLTLMTDMRHWQKTQAPLRAVLLIGHIQRIVGTPLLASWLERPNPLLTGASPLEEFRTSDCAELAQLLDALLSGPRPPLSKDRPASV